MIGFGIIRLINVMMECSCMALLTPTVVGQLHVVVQIFFDFECFENWMQNQHNFIIIIINLKQTSIISKVLTTSSFSFERFIIVWCRVEKSLLWGNTEFLAAIRFG